MIEICNHGYWVINYTKAFKSVMSKCVECRLLRGKMCQKKMGNIPANKLLEKPPFTYCEVDMFGHFWLKMVGRFERDIGRCLRVYPSGQCTSNRQAI